MAVKCYSIPFCSVLLYSISKMNETARPQSGPNSRTNACLVRHNVCSLSQDSKQMERCFDQNSTLCEIMTTLKRRKKHALYKQQLKSLVSYQQCRRALHLRRLQGPPPVLALELHSPKRDQWPSAWGPRFFLYAQQVISVSAGSCFSDRD